MNKLIAILAIMLTTSVHAEICDDLSQLSGSIMGARQAGVKMSTMMQTAKSDDPLIEKYSKNQVKLAFFEPKYRTKEYQDNAVLEFENGAYQRCVEAMGK